MFKEINLPGVYPGRYLVNEVGEIYSNFKKGYLSPASTKRGYLSVQLGRGVRYQISHIVAYTFIGPPPKNLKDPTINHIDGDIHNNYYNNLEWIERSENSKKKFHQVKGVQTHFNKYTEKQILDAWELLNTTELSLAQIAEKVGIKSGKTVQNIRSGQAWKWLTSLHPYPRSENMPINIYSVKNHLEENGWKLISSTYKNLNTELEMQCPEGHTQFITYGDWRKHPICEQCMAGDPYKIKKNKVPIKKIDTQRILALDAATVITGYSIFDDGELVSYGTHKVDKNLSTEQRINEMKKWLVAVLQEWEPDFVGIENIQLQQFGKGQYQVEMYRALANLQGVLIDTIFEACIDHDLAYAASWRNYCNVGDDRGRENKKKAAQEKVKLWYNQDCTQDEADAICIGKYFAHLLKNSKSSWGEDI